MQTQGQSSSDFIIGYRKNGDGLQEPISFRSDEIDAFFFALRNDPLLSSMTNYTCSKFTSAAEVIALKRLAALKIYSDTWSSTEDLDLDAQGFVPFKLNDKSRRNLALALAMEQNCKCFLFDEEVVDVYTSLAKKAINARDESNVELAEPILPFSPLWIAFPSRCGCRVDDKYQFEFHAQFLTYNLRGQLCCFYLDFEENRLVSTALGMGNIDALATLLSQRIVTQESMGLSRQMRKRQADAGLPPDETVHFLKLREPSKAEKRSNTGETKISFHRRWLVRGHFREQWYPARKNHQLKWIDPYVKGPDDAPFIESVGRLS